MDSEHLIYFDTACSRGFFAVEPNPGEEIVFTGVQIHQEPESTRVTEDACKLAQAGLHLYFQNDRPVINFYPVPALFVLGHDGRGGYFATGESDCLITDTETMYYITPDRELYSFPGSIWEMATGEVDWRGVMQPCEDVEIFANRKAANQKYDIHDFEELF